MGSFNLGNKDEFGNQSRIEHRGKHLRVSRTGGASLRAQTKAAGLNLTANSKHGVRVSRSVGKNTQMAMQNGRFILRGRYGKGPTKVNLSKSGVSFSTRNQLGSFNWVKPNRSSAKVFGVQVRGKNAATTHVLFMLFTAVFEVVRVAAQILLVIISWLWVLLLTVWRLICVTPFAIQQARRAWLNHQVLRARKKIPAEIKSSLSSWKTDQLITATALAFLAWGRGIPASEISTVSIPTQQASLQNLLGTRVLDRAVGASLDEWQRLMSDAPPPRSMLAVVSLLGQSVAAKLDHNRIPELLLSIDELSLVKGPKTCLQEQMLEVFCEAAELRLELNAPQER